ncbi:PKH1 [Candida jiufengensis]|uniref:PKH1 n=1 Tax=Candida jiufengensis TaxID=497108 RepID=UPI0022248CDB|nr:PKH1 [Candida jiufengensis]KAI5954643.1 PKH1 [Candida jiufengensis]
MSSDKNGIHGLNSNKKNTSHLQDLTNDIKNIYKNYTSNNNNNSSSNNGTSHDSSHNDSIESLESQNNQGQTTYTYKFQSPNSQNHNHNENQNLPSVHISSRLSSLEGSELGEAIAKSAPGTPLSINSFDFRPRYPRAITNSSLNVLLDTPNGDNEFKQSSQPNSNKIINDENDGIPRSSEYIEDEENWENKGAAIRKMETPTGEISTIRRSVNDFKFGKELGEGSYSTVILATDKITSKQYAVKVLDKRHIIKEKKVKYVNIEKHALNRLSNRMGVISLYFTFQDKDSLYFVLDYAANGELLTLIKKYNTLNEDCTRYFGAQILDAIKYMHDNGVIHRDIKPENILLDDKMRIQITDFGTARLLEKKDDESEDYPVDVRAKSFVGTAEYVSPELLESKYCGKPGDIWAFGCIIYQMIAGKPPFKATNEYLTFQKITKLQYAFSAGFPNIIRDLIKKILVLQPSKRVTIPEIQNHFFFKPIKFDDFDQLWLSSPPEIGPYKMSAKSMMKVPNVIKHSPTNILPKKKTKKPTTNEVKSAPSTPSIPMNNDSPLTRTTTNGIVTTNGGEKVNAANAAAAALNKPSTSESSLADDSLNTGSKPSSNDSRRSSRASQPDYIPGTNILRPQINTRPSVQSYSRTSSAREKPKPPPIKTTKPEVMEVTPLSTLEAAWGSFLDHQDERIIRVGPVIVHKEGTDAFERKHRGLLHASPLVAGKTQRSRSNTSLLSQMVNGVPETTSEFVDENVAITEPQEVKYLKKLQKRKESKKSVELERSPSTGSNLIKKHSIFRKLGLSQSDKKDGTEEITNPFTLDKPQTCTMVVTTHGRALVFARKDLESPYKLILEVKLKYPFIRFQELVTPQTKFSKLLPSVGVFLITSIDSSYIFEVEKYEVNQWTEALAKGKTNEIEREKLPNDQRAPQKRQTSSSSSSNSPIEPPPPPPPVVAPKPVTTTRKTTNKESPKLMDSPSFFTPPVILKPTRSSSKSPTNHHSNAQPSPTKEPSTTTTTHTSKPSSMLKSRMQRSTPKRKPPPVSPPNELNVHTGLPKTSNETGFLHAAQLAVSQNAHNPISTNRRSSFTKEDGSKIDPNKSKIYPSRNGSGGHYNYNSSSSPINNPNSPMVTSMNSKLLARSNRK